MFIKIKAIKYQGNMGTVVEVPMWLNMYAISYVDITDGNKLIVHLIGETGSGLSVIDKESIQQILSSVR